METHDFKTRVASSFKNQPFMDHLKAELSLVEKGKCHISIPYQKELTQQNGFIHAGVLSTLADNAAGYAAFSVMDASSLVLSVEYKINLLAPAVGESFIAKTEVLKHGKTLTICRSDVYAIKEGIEKLCASAQCTLIERKLA